MVDKRGLVMLTAVLMGATVMAPMNAALRGGSEQDTAAPADMGEAVTEEETLAPDTTTGMEPVEEMPARPAPRPTKKGRILSGSDGFIAGPDWEFDGFVAGGQGQEVRSMFVVNDLLYLNVGMVQGLQAGDRVGIYKRGDRVKDPQSGRFIGYEVRWVGVSEITDKIDDETCSARVIRTNDGIEIGDLVRKETGR